jgi:hypothetical protein
MNKQNILSHLQAKVAPEKMSRKAAELPMNFIVIAAIAVIVLILIIMLLMGGIRTEAINSQTAANACGSKCFAKARVSVTEPPMTSGQAILGMDDYCTKQDIKGIGTKTCADISPCTLTLSSGPDCKVKCDTTTNLPVCT